MRGRQHIKWAVAVPMLTAIAVTGGLLHSPRVQAQSDRQDHDWRIERGLEIAPVPLDLDGKNRDEVGLGSYLVNAMALLFQGQRGHPDGNETILAIG